MPLVLLLHRDTAAVPPETQVRLEIKARDVGSPGWRERAEEKGVDVFDGECTYALLYLLIFPIWPLPYLPSPPYLPAPPCLPSVLGGGSLQVQPVVSRVVLRYTQGIMFSTCKRELCVWLPQAVEGPPAKSQPRADAVLSGKGTGQPVCTLDLSGTRGCKGLNSGGKKCMLWRREAWRIGTIEVGGPIGVHKRGNIASWLEVEFAVPL